MKTKHVKTTAYHPATNGLTERFNKTLADMLAKYVSSNHKDWDEVLDYVTFAYNSAIQESTKYSPFFLLYGREPSQPSDIVMGIREKGMSSLSDYVNKTREKLERAREVATSNIMSSAKKNEKIHNKTHREVEFEIGSLVLLYRPIRKNFKTS